MCLITVGLIMRQSRKNVVTFERALSQQKQTPPQVLIYISLYPIFKKAKKQKRGSSRTQLKQLVIIRKKGTANKNSSS